MTRQLIRDALIVNGDGRTAPYPGDVLIDDDVIVALGAVTASQAASADRRHRRARPGARAGFRRHPQSRRARRHGDRRQRPAPSPASSPFSAASPSASAASTACRRRPSPRRSARNTRRSSSRSTAPSTANGRGRSIAEFLAWHRGRSVTDMGIYLGHSAVRRVVMANVARVASDAELAAMAEVVRREAPLTLGLSTGLVYNPAVYCDQRELTALVRAFNEVKPGALFPHLRSESDNIIASVKEVVEAAVDGGGGYCNEHSKIAGAQNYDRIGELESILADAASLIPTMENMYPYTAGSTTGDAIFPPEMRAGGRAEFLARPRRSGAAREDDRQDALRLDELGQFHPFLRRAAGHPDRRGEAGGRRRLARQASRRRRARRRRRRSRQRRSLRSGVRFLRRQCRRDRDHHPLRQRGDDGALLPPADDGDLHRRPDAGAGTEAASALARRRSPRRCAWGARWAFRSSRWSGGWRRCPAAFSTSPTRRSRSAPTPR